MEDHRLRQKEALKNYQQESQGDAGGNVAFSIPQWLKGGQRVKRYKCAGNLISRTPTTSFQRRKCAPYQYGNHRRSPPAPKGYEGSLLVDFYLDSR